MSDDYTCFLCKGRFRNDCSEEDCKKEFRERFGREPTAEDMAAPLCEDCRDKVLAFMRTRMN